MFKKPPPRDAAVSVSVISSAHSPAKFIPFSIFRQ
jgi:hypothetical protein